MLAYSSRRDGFSYGTFFAPVCQTAYAEQLEQPITNDELLADLRAGAYHKSPGIDGLSLNSIRPTGKRSARNYYYSLIICS